MSNQFPEVTPDPWGAEKQRCILFAGTTFVAHLYGYTYEWRAEDWIGARTCDRKPFLLCHPIKRLSGKQGRLRSAHIFHAEYLPKQ